MGQNIANSQFEYIFCFSGEGKRRIGTREFRGTISNVLRLNSRQEKTFSDVHKATFPSMLPGKFISDFSQNTVVDPFLGTGSTLIAAEQTGRKCFGMEIDPKYCAVIIQRFFDATGKEPVLLS